MVVYTIDAALENRKISLNRVRANQNVSLFPSVNLPRMANRAVTPELLSESAIACVLVRHHVCVPQDILPNHLLERPTSDALCVEGTHLAAALDYRHNGSLILLAA